MKRTALLLGLATLLAACGDRGTAASVTGVQKIDHLIVVYQENWSFDSLYGKFPGANGLAQAASHVPQVAKDGSPLSVLPQPLVGGKPDPRFPADLPVQPFDAARYVAPTAMTGDLVHRFYQEQYQLDSGKQDRFVAWSDAAGLAMSYYDATDMPEGKLAQQYVMADNFFHGAFGGSFLNHIWLICTCAPTWPNPPAAIVAQLDAAGKLVKDGQVTPDGFAVNTSQTVNTPHAPNTPAANLLPNQTLPTIGDRLTARQVGWAWYSGGWNQALAGKPDPLFQFHHQPFTYFQNYADGTPAKAQHLKDEVDFTTALNGGTLPAVSFVKPIGEDNEHPGYADEARGQQHVADLVKAVQSSRYWNSTAVVITYDENGGRWDHMPVPQRDRWGPGTRVPTIVISPYAKRGFVDHTLYDTSSILRFIEKRWSLQPLGTADAAANDLTNAFDFSQAARKP